MELRAGPLQAGEQQLQPPWVPGHVQGAGEGGRAPGVRTQPQKPEENQEGGKSLRIERKREVREGKGKGEPREDTWLLKELQRLLAVTSQAQLLSLLRCVPALAELQENAAFLSTWSDSSPLRDTQSPAGLTTSDKFWS